MNVALYQYRPAIRLYKLAVTLKNIGYDVVIYKDRERQPVPDLYWDRFVVKNIKNVPNKHDFLIAFNPVMKVPDIAARVVQYVGDLRGIKSPCAMEHANLNNADKCLFVSQRQMVHAIMLYGINPDKCVVLYNGTINEMKGELKPQTPGTVVYSGTLSSINGHHRNIFDQLRNISKQYHLHIYPSSLGIPETYNKLDAVIHKTVKPYDLIGELSQYQYGYIAVSDSIVASHMLPNKLFEYISAGLEVLWETVTEEQNIMIRTGATYESQLLKITQIIS
jgi:hypothetical protein